MVNSERGLVPFSESVLEAIIRMHTGAIPFDGEGSLQSVLIQFLYDKGYIEIKDLQGGRYIILSKGGQKFYDELCNYVSGQIGV